MLQWKRCSHAHCVKMVLLLVYWFGTWGCTPARAALQVADVPTFQIRARVTSVGGQPPGASSSFGFSYWSLRGLLTASSVTAVGGAWSDWLPFGSQEVSAILQTYPATNMDGFPVVLLLHVDGVVDPTLVEAQLQFGGTSTPITLNGDLFGPNLGIVVWRDADNTPRAGTMADYNQRFWQQMGGDPYPESLRPKKFPIVDRFIGGDDDRRDWREGIQNVLRSGCSVLQLPPTRQIRDLLLETGLHRVAWAVFDPPGYTFDYGADATPQKVQSWAQSYAEAYRNAGYAPGDMALFNVLDEPGWYYPAVFQQLADNSGAVARFRSYLRSQNLQPGDLGARSWDGVFPMGGSHVTDIASHRLFYWTMRFFSWDSSRYMAEVTQDVRNAFGAPVPVATNWNNFNGRFYVPGAVANNPNRQDPDAAMGHHDWFEFARMGGGSMLWTEDWFEDPFAYRWSFFSSKMRCAARKSGAQFGGYVITRTAGERADGLLQRILTLIGSGGKALVNYEFGPEYLFPGNCYSASLDSGLVPKLQEANEMIGAAEDLLWPGQRPTAQVAILMPRSSEVWDAKNNVLPKDRYILDAAQNVGFGWTTVDYMAEVYFLYEALEHANIPVDFVDEDDLTRSGPSPYRVLYVTEPDIPVEGQQAIASWVLAGGTLVTVPQAGTRDRYDQPSSVLSSLTDIVEQPADPLIMMTLSSLAFESQGHSALGDFLALGGAADSILNASGPLRPFSTSAVFANGSPAVMSRRAGHGRVVHFAFMPGMSYEYSAVLSMQTMDNLQQGYPEAVRQWIVSPTRQAGVRPPVVVDQAMVESPMLLSSAGAAVTLLNWTGQSLPGVHATIRVPFTVASVTSVKHGALKFEQTPDGTACSLPLGAADILMIRPASGSPRGNRKWWGG